MTNAAKTPSCSCYFEAQHEQHTHPAMRALERDVLGCDFGGTSWTTKRQADKIPTTLGLTAESKMLEIGAGTGWPGVYLAGLTGCDVTLLDIPVNSLNYAMQRAVEDRIEGRCQAVAASGAALPFATSTFDAIGHSDVLCCLLEKLEMLKECRRVARDGGKMLFYVIAPPSGLTGVELDEACEIGPPFVGVPDDYEELLAKSAWKITSKSDLTNDYLLALQRLAEGLQAASVNLKKVLGPIEFNDQLVHRRQQISAIERGLLVRDMYLVQAI
jgi:SAM-dependent methyltransferase